MSQHEEKAYPAEDDYPTEDNNNQAPADEAHEPAEANNDRAADAHSVTSDDAAKKEDEEGAPADGTAEKKAPFSIFFFLFAFMTFGGWVLCMAGIALGMMDSKTNSSCISIWGPKPKCTGTWFRALNWQEFKNGSVCDKGYSLTQGAQAFSVMSVIGGFLVTVVAILELLHFAELAVVAGIMASINCVATLVTWSTMMAYYYSNMCGMIRYRDHYKIGNGLILFITAWCMQVLAMIFLIVDVCQSGAS